MLNVCTDSEISAALVHRGTPDAPTRRTPSAYAGPERRTATAALVNLLGLMIDEIDYGMALLDEFGQVIHTNHLARVELDGHPTLKLVGTTLHAPIGRDANALRGAVSNAALHHRRCLLKLGEGAHKIMVSVVPLVHHSHHAPAVVLVFGKRQVCEDLSVNSFARAHRLSSTESRVLAALCSGSRVRDIADQHGVEVCTLRTQIGSIRAKTGAESISALLRQVAVLPPLVGALRSRPAS